MLNFIWAGMLLVGVVFAAIRGEIGCVTDAALASAKEAVNLCITMLGVMSFWMGLMEIATKAGVVRSLSKMLAPLLGWLFPKIPRTHKAKEHIATNVVANMLGLGWAATPAGLKAMEELDHLQEQRGSNRAVASDEMCTFLVLNISSLQIIPITLLAYRSQYGSVNPARIVGAGLVATCISTLVGCLFCKWMCRKRGAA